MYIISSVAQMVKNLPAVQDIQVQSLDQEDPLEKGMATHSRILTWKIPWTEEPGGLQFMGSQRVRHDWVTNTFTLLSAPNGFKFIEVDAVVLILKLKKTWGPERLSNLSINT